VLLTCKEETMKTNKINSRTLLPGRKHAALFINLVLVLSLLMQPIAPLFAQSSDEAPPSDPADRVVETWQDDENFAGIDDTPTPLPPAIELPATASTMAELIPASLSTVAAEGKENNYTAVIPPEGLAITFSNLPLMLIADSGAVEQEVTVSLSPQTTVPAVEAGGLPGSVLAYHLAFTAADGTPITHFNRPVYVVVDLRNMLKADETITEWFIAFQDDNDRSAWRYHTATIHDKAGLISVGIQTFAPAATLVTGAVPTNEETITSKEAQPLDDPNTPSPWRYRWELPAVSTYSGAATVSYSIPVPPGRAGLQPNIDISYSSRGLDALTFTNVLDQGPLGLGWSINNIQITRDETMVRWDHPHYRLYHGYRFSLVLNGQSHRLILHNISGNIYTFYAVNAPQLRIRQISVATPLPTGMNSDGIYWTVQTPDGTTYRLGYNEDAETGQSIYHGSLLVTEGQPGQQQGGARYDYGGLRWLVDTVTDVHGNQIQYDYESWNEEAEYYGDEFIVTSRAVLREVRYNYANRAPDANTRVTGSYASKINFILEDHRVDKIKLYHLDLAAPYKVFDVEIGEYHHSNNPCGQGYRNNHVFGVNFIQEKNGVESLSLPATTYSYVTLPHNIPRPLCNNFSYVQEVNNGYGGRMRFTYTADGRFHGDPNVPEYGQSYFVTQTERWDGLSIHPNPAITSYNFEFPCYDQQDGNVGTRPGATNCPAGNQQDPFAYPHGPLSGFAQVTITTQDYDSATLNKQFIQFRRGLSTDPANADYRGKAGRPYLSQLKDANDFVLQQTNTTYATDTGTSFNFSYTSQECTTAYIRGGQSSQHCVNYSYERQSNVQYGNLTRIEEEGYIGGLSNQKRLIYREYYPNTTNWIVNKVAREAVFTGTQGQPIDPVTATPTSNTRNYYDSNPSWNNPPILGKLTKVSQLKTGTTYITTQEVTYDGTAGTYGLPTIVRDGRNNPTTVTYDTTYYLYPISIANAAGHTQSLTYNYLNSPNDDGPPGTLDGALNANGLWTYYRYDAFSRLTRLFRGWEEQGGDWNKPSEIYQYNDSDSPFRITSWRKTQDNATAWLAGGVWERTFYDGFGRPIQVQTPHTDWSGNAVNGATTGQQRILDTVYNAAGQAISQSEPYLVAAYGGSGSYYVTPSTTADQITSTYDPTGRAVQTIGLDGAVTSSIYGACNPFVPQIDGGQDGRDGLCSQYVQDGNNHIKVSYFDVAGQLVQVQELVDTFSDDFADGNLDGWNQSGDVTASGGVVTLTGDNTYNNSIGRTLSTNGYGGAAFSFKVSNTSMVANMYLDLGTYGTSSYRRWAIRIENQELKLEQYVGASHPTTTLMPVKANTWYRAVLNGNQPSGAAAYHTLVIWEAANPAQIAEVRLRKDTNWQHPGWRFGAQAYSNGMSLTIDNYDELEFKNTRYQYNLVGNLTQVTGSLGHITNMTYDKLGRKTVMTDPDMGTWSYVYDNAGNLISQRDNTQAIAFGYDSLNRLISKRQINSSGPLLATYGYDDRKETGGNEGRGFRTSMIAYDPPGTVSNSATWKYDSLGRMTQETRTIGTNVYTFQHGYTQGNLPVTITYPGGNGGQLGEVVTTNYHWQTGQPKTHVGDSNYVQEAQYNRADGQITRLNMPNTSVYTTFGYEAAHRINSIHTVANGSDRLWFSYNYDKVGNIISMLDAVPPGGGSWQWQYFSYDSLNRLTRGYTTGGNGGTYDDSFSYDALGNLTNKDGVAMGYGQASGIAAGAKPHAVTHLNGSPTARYVYNSNGNMTSRNDGTTTWAYTWTRENMLKTATGGSNTLSFVYDADNRMVQRVANGTTLIVLGKLYEHNITGNIVKKYYHLNGKMAALRRIGPGGNNVYYFATDHLGSTTVLLNSSGTIRHNVRYDPWGKERWSSGLAETNYMYTGQWNDANLGLYNYNARYYDPAIGKFISADVIVPEPASPQSLNRFAYARNNLLNRIDPNGHQDIPALMQQAIDFFTSQGWQIVGNPALINASWNGADLVFVSSDGGRVLAVELKDVSGNVNLGTLGRGVGGEYGGSLARFTNSAFRFLNSSNAQLRLMSQIVFNASESGTLENALFTSSKEVSAGAQGVFNGVYKANNGNVIADKALQEIRQPGFWAKAGAAWTTFRATAQTTIQATGTQLQAVGTQLIGALSTSPLLAPIYIPPEIRDQVSSPDKI
jgi:RHS repeat-associated protein